MERRNTIVALAVAGAVAVGMVSCATRCVADRARPTAATSMAPRFLFCHSSRQSFFSCSRRRVIARTISINTTDQRMRWHSISLASASAIKCQ